MMAAAVASSCQWTGECHISSVRRSSFKLVAFRNSESSFKLVNESRSELPTSPGVRQSLSHLTLRMGLLKEEVLQNNQPPFVFEYKVKTRAGLLCTFVIQ